MFTMTFQPPATTCTPDSVSVEWFYSSTAITGPCYADFYSDLTWTNPCGTSYAVSYYYEIIYDLGGGLTPTVVFTSDTRMRTMVPGVEDWGFEFIGEVTDPQIHGPGQTCRVKLYVTYPDTVTRVYTSYDDTVTPC